MDPLLLAVWIIAAIALAAILGLTGIAVAIDVIIARRLGYPRRRPVVAALLSFLVLSVASWRSCSWCCIGQTAIGS
jgi:hypothetical protein